MRNNYRYFYSAEKSEKYLLKINYKIGVAEKYMPATFMLTKTSPADTVGSRYVLVSNPKIANVFYAVNNPGIFCSIDLCISRKMLGIITIYDGQRSTILKQSRVSLSGTHNPAV
ncbi:MAG: hypothetical protein ACJ73C_16210 [Nitrososphaeraceae archaeon]